MAKRKKLPAPSGEKLEFVVTLERPETGTTIRYLEYFSPFNTATGQLYTNGEFGKALEPYVREVGKKFNGWNLYVELATNEDIAELSANPLDN